MTVTPTTADGEALVLSEAAQGRHDLMEQNLGRLEQIAHRAIHVKGLGANDFIIVCIKVDSRWRSVVDQLMPEHDWQQYRDQGMQPIARGSVAASFADYLAEELPDLREALREVYPYGKAKAVVLDDTGGTVYEIEPKPESGVH